MIIAESSPGETMDAVVDKKVSDETERAIGRPCEPGKEEDMSLISRCLKSEIASVTRYQNTKIPATGLKSFNYPNLEMQRNTPLKNPCTVCV